MVKGRQFSYYFLTIFAYMIRTVKNMDYTFLIYMHSYTVIFSITTKSRQLQVSSKKFTSKLTTFYHHDVQKKSPVDVLLTNYNSLQLIQQFCKYI